MVSALCAKRHKAPPPANIAPGLADVAAGMAGPGGGCMRAGPESQALPVWKHQKEELIQGAKNAGSRSFHQDIML